MTTLLAGIPSGAGTLFTISDFAIVMNSLIVTWGDLVLVYFTVIDVSPWSHLVAREHCFPDPLQHLGKAYRGCRRASLRAYPVDIAPGIGIG